MKRGILLWALAALLGIALTAGVTWAASHLVSQHIGLSSEPLTVVNGLAPQTTTTQSATQTTRTTSATVVTRTRTATSTLTTTAPAPAGTQTATTPSISVTTTPAPVVTQTATQPPTVRGHSVKGSDGGDSAHLRRSSFDD